MKTKSGYFLFIVPRIISFFIIFTGCLTGYLFEIQIFKIVFGIIIAGYLPGFYLIKILFPQSSILSTIEKIVLTITFSFIISMILALVLNLIPSGLSYWNIVLSLGGIIFSLLIVSLIQDRRLLSTSNNPMSFQRPSSVLLIPIVTLSVAFFVLAFFNIDKSVDFVEFSIEKVEFGPVENNGNKDFYIDLLVQNNTEYDTLFKIDSLSEGNIITASNQFLIMKGESQTVELIVFVNESVDRLEFVLTDVDKNLIVNRLWYQVR